MSIEKWGGGVKFHIVKKIVKLQKHGGLNNTL
jgi:hypothetical protein